ncbi:MAG: hypothetical protein ACLTDV_13355 [Eubacterium sp.]
MKTIAARVSKVPNGVPTEHQCDNGFLNIDNKKMSKSLGNSLYGKRNRQRNMTFRYWCSFMLSAHYRSPIQQI